VAILNKNLKHIFSIVCANSFNLEKITPEAGDSQVYEPLQFAGMVDQVTPAGTSLKRFSALIQRGKLR
jgi:TATA-box binding protein (TBP) (component of TFIID and TFIIIB)